MVKVGRERADLALQLKENEEEMQELIKKYKVIHHSKQRKFKMDFKELQSWGIVLKFPPLLGKCRCRKHRSNYNSGPGSYNPGEKLLDCIVILVLLGSRSHFHNLRHTFTICSFHSSQCSGVGSSEKSSQRALGRS